MQYNVICDWFCAWFTLFFVVSASVNCLEKKILFKPKIFGLNNIFFFQAIYKSDKHHYSNVFRLLVLHLAQSLCWVPKKGKLYHLSKYMLII